MNYELEYENMTRELAESKRREAELQVRYIKLSDDHIDQSCNYGYCIQERDQLKSCVKKLEEKFAEFGGAQEAYDELMIIWRLFDDEFGQPNEGEDSLSQLVSQVIQHRDILNSKSSDCAGRVKTLEDALMHIHATTFNQSLQFLCVQALAAKEPPKYD